MTRHPINHSRRCRGGPQDSADFPPLMAGVALIGAAGCASAVWPAVEHIVGAGLLAAPLAVGAVWAARRETRIRRRLTDTCGTTGATGRRAGPGEPSPAPPAPSTRTPAYPHAVADTEGAMS